MNTIQSCVSKAGDLRPSRSSNHSTHSTTKVVIFRHSHQRRCCRHIINLVRSRFEKVITSLKNFMVRITPYSVNFIGEISSPISPIIFRGYLATPSKRNLTICHGPKMKKFLQRGAKVAPDFLLLTLACESSIPRVTCTIVCA